MRVIGSGVESGRRENLEYALCGLGLGTTVSPPKGHQSYPVALFGTPTTIDLSRYPVDLGSNSFLIFPILLALECASPVLVTFPMRPIPPLCR